MQKHDHDIAHCGDTGHQSHAHHAHGEGDGGIYSEFLCHLPYAIFSVAFCLIVLSLLDFIGFGLSPQDKVRGLNRLFHSFHFLHIVFASTGAVVTFMRFSRNHLQAFLVALISPPIFCMLSDAILPYFAGELLGVHMEFHVCFYSELRNVLPFLLVGIVNGFAMSKHHQSVQSSYSIGSHFLHIFVSALASTFYMISHGLTNWYPMMGIIFFFLIVVVVLPCTMSDIVVPMMMARRSHKK